MNRATTLPLLFALVFAVPLAAAAQTDADANTGAPLNAASAPLPQAAASAASASAPSSSDDKAFEQQDAAERKRIADGRAAARDRYTEDQRDCWQRFAVNACLDRARERRRAVLDALRHDELTLNAQERQRRTAARLNEIADKQAESAQRNGNADVPTSSASGAQ